MRRETVCPACKCTDSQACVMEGATGDPELCYWVWKDPRLAVGLCSRCFPSGSPPREAVELAREWRRIQLQIKIIDKRLEEILGAREQKPA